MSPRANDDRAVGLAVARGLVRLRDVQVALASAEDAARHAATPAERRPTPLDELVATGALRPDVADALRREVVRLTGAPDGEGVTGDGEGAPRERFLVEEELGAGGMGRVYRAFDTRLGRYVALKFLTRDSPADVERFLAESRAQARVEHENVCRVYDAGDLDGRPFIAMQLVRGGSITSAAPKLTLEQKLSLMRRVADAVHAAHQTGLVHRDLKPSNVLVEKTEAGVLAPYVVDFGLARDPTQPSFTQTGLVVGTLHYMAPEQATGGTIDRRTDVYGLGATLYEVLSGRPPFDEKSAADVLRRVVDEDPVSLDRRIPDIPADVATIVGRCLAKEPARRYQTARELAEDLGRFLDGEPIQARKPTLTYVWKRRIQRHKAAATVAAVSLLLLVALLGALLFTRWEAGRRTELAARFGRDVSGIENVLRLGRMLALHDLSKEKALVRTRMKELSGEGSRLGRVARGPLAYALGRGHLALGELDAARGRLEESRRLGETSPESSLALGAALSGIWGREQREARRIPNDTLRKAALEELEKRYRPRIEELLRVPATAASAGGAEGAELFRARLLLSEGKTAEAVAEARRARETRPWLAEASFVEGIALNRDADVTLDAGKLEEAAALWERSERALVEGLSIAPSHEQGWEDLAEVRTARLRSEVWRGKRQGLEELARRALDATASGLLAHPGSDGLLTLRAFIHARLSEAYTYFGGGDPMPALAAGEAAAREALDRNPRSARALETLGDLLLTKGDQLAKSDPGAALPVYDEAVPVLDRALALEPRSASLLNLRGASFSQRARSERKLGRDPRPSLRRAAADQEAGIAIVETVNGLMGLQNTRIQLANTSALAGEDPSADCAAVTDVGRRVLKLAPKNTFARNGLSLAPYVRAKYLLFSGGSPEAELLESRRLLKEAIEADPKDPFPWFNLSATERFLAMWLEESGKDPLPAVQASVEAAEKGFAADSSFAQIRAERAQTRAFEVRARARRKLPTREALAAARADLAIAQEKAPTLADTLRAAAEIELAAHEAGEAGALARARASYDKALAALPNDADIHLGRAELALAGGLPREEGLSAARRALELRRGWVRAQRVREKVEAPSRERDPCLLARHQP